MLLLMKALNAFGRWRESSAEISRLATEISRARRNYSYQQGLTSEKNRLLAQKEMLESKWISHYVPALRLRQEFEDELEFSESRPQEYLTCMMEQLNVVELHVLKKLAYLTFHTHSPGLDQVKPIETDDAKTPEPLSPTVWFPEFPVSASFLSPSTTAHRLEELRMLLEQLLNQKKAMSASTNILIYECNKLRKELCALRASMREPPASLYESLMQAVEARRKSMIEQVLAVRAHSTGSESSHSNLTERCSTDQSSIDSVINEKKHHF